jgi:HEAT repeat protein
VAILVLLSWSLTSPASPSEPPATDPVAQLRQTLKGAPEDLTQTDPVLARQVQAVKGPAEEQKLLLQAWDRQLARQVKAIRSLPDIRRALLLRDWRLESDDNVTGPIARKHRADLAERFQQEARRVLQKGSPLQRQAALVLLAEMDPQVPSATGKGGLTRAVAPDVETLIEREKDADLRAAAARALGKLNPEPARAAQVLKDLLRARTPVERRAAAEGLLGLVETLKVLVGPPVWRWASSQAQADSFSPQVVEVGCSVLPVAAQGISDTDAQVRRLCLETLRQTALALNRQLPEPPREYDESMNEKWLAVKHALKELPPLVLSLRDQLPKVVPALGDANFAVCLAANQALEAIGTARLGWLRLAALTPRRGDAKALDDPLGPGLRAAVPGLVALVPHQDVRFRLAALYVLETLEADAAPAAQVVVQALRD